MKPYFFLISILFIVGCSKDATNRNPFLPEVRFNFELNLNLPLYNGLNTIGNPVYVGGAGVGIRGVFVMRTSVDAQFMAWEANCPNQVPNTCSTMEIEGQEVVCPCDDLRYSLFTGQLLNRPDDGSQAFDLLFYRTTTSGNSVFVSN